jgi:hypothetical protein
MRKALMLATAGALALSACGREPVNESADRTADALPRAVAEPSPERYAPTGPAADTAPQPKLAVRAPPTQARIDSMTESLSAAPSPVEPQRIAPPARPVRPAPLAPVASIAYGFSYVLSASRERGPEMMSEHEYACASAGPGLCQVVTATSHWGARDAGGKLELRGQPEWINRFRSRLALDARNAGGRLETSVTEGENVTRDIDETRTGAATTASLTDRIRDLQRRHGGTLQQQMEIERQIADLQRLQDAQQIELRALNDRVLSANLTIDYRESGAMAANSPTRPVVSALQNAFALSMGMLALIITVGSVTLPIAAIGGVVWWALRRRRKLSAAATGAAA